MGRLMGKLLLLLSVLIVGCQKKTEDAATVAAVKTLYATTGICNAGFGTAAMLTYAGASSVSGIPSRSVERFATDTGQNKGYLMDFSASNFVAFNNPMNIIDGGENLFILIENFSTTSERAIWKVPKNDPFNFVKYASNTTAFSTSSRGLARDGDGSFLAGVGTKIEKFNATPQRITAGANAFLTAPAIGNCSSSGVLVGVTALQIMQPLAPATNGKIIFAHQSIASTSAPLQRIGVVGPNGYFAAADCVGGTQISSVTHTRASSSTTTGAVAFSTSGTSPTSMVYIPMAAGSTVTGKLVVTYSNNATSNYVAGVYNLNHAIVMWDITETSATAVTINNPVILYDNVSVVYGPSAIAFDSADNSLYVGVSGEPGAANLYQNGIPYNIEKFRLDYNTPSLTRIDSGGQPFVKGGTNLKCVSGLTIGE